MKFSNAIISSILTLSISSLAYSEEVKKVHSFGVQLGGGGLEYKGHDFDDQGVGQWYTYYNYQFVPNFSIEAGLVAGEDVDDWDDDWDDWNDDWECEGNNDNWICYSNDQGHFEFSAVVLALKADVNLSQRNKIFAKVGVEFYEYEIGFRDREIIDEEGTGFFVEAGWQYRWELGIGMNVSLQYHDMDDLEMSSVNAGISYAF